jgi:hypothetical protein
MWWYSEFDWVLAMIVIFGFIVAIRLIKARERIALVDKGVPPQDLEKVYHDRHEHVRTRTDGLMAMAVGAALLIVLYPAGWVSNSFTFGFGPWLVAGLVPLFVWAALFATRLSSGLEHLRSAFVPMAVGAALLIGLYPIGLHADGSFPLGLGPWLLAGLIPLFVGLVNLVTKLAIEPHSPQSI